MVVIRHRSLGFRCPLNLRFQRVLVRLLLRFGLADAAGGTPCPIGFWNGLLLGRVATGVREPAVWFCDRVWELVCWVPCAKADAPSANMSGVVTRNLKAGIEMLHPRQGAKKLILQASVRFPVGLGKRSPPLAGSIKRPVRCHHPFDALSRIDDVPFNPEVVS